MKTIKMAVSRTSLATRILSLRNEAKARLKKFCINKVIEAKLGTKSFSFDFDFDNTHDGGQRKSLQRLRLLLWKALEKQIPYISYAKGTGFFENNSQTSVTVELYLRPVTVKMNAYKDASEEIGQSRQVKAVKRYISKLNRISRKNRQCFKFTANVTHVVKPESRIAQERAMSINRTNFVEVDYLPRIKVTITLGFWSATFLDDFRNMVRNNQALLDKYDTIEKFIAGAKTGELVPYGILGDTDYYDSMFWTLRGMREASIYPTMADFCVPESMFLYLNQMVKILKTFSRVTTYDSSAFNIGVLEA